MPPHETPVRSSSAVEAAAVEPGSHGGACRAGDLLRRHPLLDTPPRTFAVSQRVRLNTVAAAGGEVHADPLPFDPAGARYVCYGCVFDRGTRQRVRELAGC